MAKTRVVRFQKLKLLGWGWGLLKVLGRIENSRVAVESRGAFRVLGNKPRASHVLAQCSEGQPRPGPRENRTA